MINSLTPRPSYGRMIFNSNVKISGWILMLLAFKWNSGTFSLFMSYTIIGIWTCSRFFWSIFGVKEVLLNAFWSCVHDDPQNRDIRKLLCDLIRKPGLLSDALDSVRKLCIILSGTLLCYHECGAKSEFTWWYLSSPMCLFSELDDCVGRSLVRKVFCKWKVSTCRLVWKSIK